MTIAEAKEKGYKVFEAQMQSDPDSKVYIGEDALSLENTNS